MTTVLIVEDDPVNLRVFSKILTKRGGMEVKDTEDVEEVMKIAQAGASWQWGSSKGLKGASGDITRRKAEDDGGKKMREPPLACKVEEAQTGRKTERARAMDRT